MPGVLLAALESRVRRRIGNGRLAATAGSMLTAAGLGLLVVFVVTKPVNPGGEGLLLATATGALVGGLLLREWAGRPAWRVLDNPPLHWLGERSYSIYLLHAVVITWVAWPSEASSPWQFVWLAAIVLVGTTLGAALLYRYVEQPAMRRRVRVAPSHHVPPVSLPGSPAAAPSQAGSSG
jgi:peptidoglycan/LPS O-acetylase OafA/YrhL